jgi:hypothetical protein
MVLQKDTLYGNEAQGGQWEGGEYSHPHIHSYVGTGTCPNGAHASPSIRIRERRYGVQCFAGVTQDHYDPVMRGVGVPEPDDMDNGVSAPNKGKFYTIALQQLLTCQSAAETAVWEQKNGTVIAQTNLIQGSDGNKRYILFFGQFGLRLIRTANFQASDLADPLNCIWLTPMQQYFWYIDGTTSYFNQRSFCRNTSTGEPLWNDPFQAYPCLNQCGNKFVKPVSTQQDVAIVQLYSKNKRFVFQMMSSGVCTLMDMKSGRINYSTDWYISLPQGTSCPAPGTYVTELANLPYPISDTNSYGQDQSKYCYTAMGVQLSSDTNYKTNFNTVFDTINTFAFQVLMTQGKGFDTFTQIYAVWNNTNNFTGKVFMSAPTSTSNVILLSITNLQQLNFSAPYSNPSVSSGWQFFGTRLVETGSYA